MDAYRDQYAQLFGTGNNVKVLAISADADTAQASWAIAHVMAPFREVDPAAYTELGDMVKKVAAMK